MPTPRKKLAACAVDHNIYVLGGVLEEGDMGLTTNERYSTLGGSWSASPPMPTGRVSLTAATVDGICYAIGGRVVNQGDILRTVEAFDPATEQWTARADMPTPRFLPSSAVIGGKIYVAGGAISGGSSGTRVSDNFEVYDPATDSWTTLPPMPTARSGTATAAMGGKLYVMGGSRRPGAQDYAVVEVYDPVTNNWETGVPLPTPRNWLSAAVAGGRIYAIGGSLHENAQNITQVFDPADTTWSAGPSLNGPRLRMAAAVVGDTIFTFGGSDSVFDPSTGMNTVEALTVEGVPQFQVTAGLNGNWWNGPARDGEGAQIEVADAGDGNLVFVATVYSYDTMGNQIFLIAVGPVNGDAAEVDVFITEGGVWGEELDPEQVIETQWGTGTFIASSCGSISMVLRPNAEFQSMGYTDLMYDLMRLTTPLVPCP